MGILAVDDIDTIGKIDLLSDHPIKENIIDDSLSRLFDLSYISKNHDEDSNWIESIRSKVGSCIEKYNSFANRFNKSIANKVYANQALYRWYNTFSYKSNYETKYYESIESIESINKCDCEKTSSNNGLLGVDFINLALAMNSNINVRDAMLIAILDCYHEWYDYDSLCAVAFESHTKSVSEYLHKCLEDKFIRYTHKPDMLMVSNVIDTLTAMAYIMRDAREFTTHIYALIAYLSWWFRFGNLEYYTNLALSVCSDCSMARIVQSAYRNGVEAPWLKEYDKDKGLCLTSRI